MKDETSVESEPARTPVLGVDWAGQTEAFEQTLSDQETIELGPYQPFGGRRACDEPRATLTSSQGTARRRSAQRGPVLVHRLWKLARSSLLGAVLCGAVCGLVLASVAIVALRLGRIEVPTGPPHGKDLIATVRVQQPDGVAVQGATIRTVDSQIQTDERGIAVFKEVLSTGFGNRLRRRFDLSCPTGMRSPESSRDLIMPGPVMSSSRAIERTLTFICEPTHVPLVLHLEVRGGEAQFWIDGRELGTSVLGRFEKTVLIPRRSELVLRAQPLVPNGESRRPRLRVPERTVVVLDEPVELKHFVEIEWPKPKTRARPRHVPYRL